MSNYVLVLSNTKKPLMPCHPARARELLNKKRASVLRQQPFTIILKDRKDGDKQPIHLKIDPGSKTTGVALVVKGLRGLRCTFGLNLLHRGQAIKDSLESRRAIRRNRRTRKTRYRKARFLNRTRPKGWLPPSIQHRVDTTLTWVKRLMLSSPVSDIIIETVSFDTQKLRNPDISGKEYQQGTLMGTYLREYLLYRYNHTCQYCSGKSGDKILEREHIHPVSRGGSDSADNATLSCRSCNKDKDNLTLTEWKAKLQRENAVLAKARLQGIERVMKGIKPSLKDAAVVNSCNNKLIKTIQEIGRPIQTSPGYITKHTRITQGYTKDHWIDAACVGGHTVYIHPNHTCLTAKAQGHGSRQMCRVDKYGFPRTSAKGPSVQFGFKTGDRVRANIPKGKYKGVWVGRVMIRSSGHFDIIHSDGKVTTHYRNLTKLMSHDGYHYSHGTIDRAYIQHQTGESVKLERKSKIIQQESKSRSTTSIVTIKRKP